jgi:hypothetical protein
VRHEDIDEHQVEAGVFQRTKEWWELRRLRMPNLQVATATEAILAGVRAAWKAPPNPILNIWDSNKLLLHEFSGLAGYLARSAIRETDADAVLRSLIGTAGPTP